MVRDKEKTLLCLDLELSVKHLACMIKMGFQFSRNKQVWRASHEKEGVKNQTQPRVSCTMQSLHTAFILGPDPVHSLPLLPCPRRKSSVSWGEALGKPSLQNCSSLGRENAYIVLQRQKIWGIILKKHSGFKTQNRSVRNLFSVTEWIIWFIHVEEILYVMVASWLPWKNSSLFSSHVLE